MKVLSPGLLPLPAVNMERRHSSQPSSTLSASSILGGSVAMQACTALMVERDICRICHCEADAEFPLISPCFCAGSLRYVHQGCLQQWIKSSDTRCCELCKFEFIMHTKIKPFRKWEKLEMSAIEQRKVLCSITFHVVAITCVVWSLYVLIERTAEEMRSGILEWTFWTKLIVVAIGFTGGLIFMYIQCKMYAQLLRRWRAFNRIIYVQDAPEKVALKLAMNMTSATTNPTTTVLTSDCILPDLVEKVGGSPIEEFHSCHSGSAGALSLTVNYQVVEPSSVTTNIVLSNVTTATTISVATTTVATNPSRRSSRGYSISEDDSGKNLKRSNQGSETEFVTQSDFDLAEVKAEVPQIREGVLDAGLKIEL